MTFDSVRRFIIPLAVPCFLLVAAALACRFWPGFVKGGDTDAMVRSIRTIAPFLPYLLWSIALLIGWRYHDTGMIVTSAAMGLAGMALMHMHWLGKPLRYDSVPSLLTLTMPLNLILFAHLGPRRLRTPMGLAVSIALCVQIVLFWFSGWFGESALTALMARQNAVMADLAEQMKAANFRFNAFLSHRGPLSAGKIDAPGLLMFLMAGLLFCYKYTKSRDILLTGYLGALGAVFITMTLSARTPAGLFFFSAAALAMIVAKIEASFSMAYNDELTGLPGRRSLNEAMINLGKKYAIAMMDIDHFKKFNDTYGHKTGDEVLKMVASRIRRTKGGARTFRYGGEEFTAVFPGKSAEEALLHLEELRRTIETTPFIVRNKAARKKGSTEKGKKTSGSKSKEVQVTISIGVAGNSRELNDPGKVIKAADKILYKAKKAGRNCVKAG